MRGVCVHSGWCVAGDTLLLSSFSSHGVGISHKGHTIPVRRYLLPLLCFLHTAGHSWHFAGGEGPNRSRKGDLSNDQQTEEGCG